MVFGIGGGVGARIKQRYISALESVITAAESHIEPLFGHYPKNGQKALQWYEMAVVGGNNLAMWDIALMYDAGEAGITENKVIAVQWY